MPGSSSLSLMYALAIRGCFAFTAGMLIVRFVFVVQRREHHECKRVNFYQSVNHIN